MKKVFILIGLIVIPWYLSAQSTTIDNGSSIIIGVGASITTGTITNQNTTNGAGLLIQSTTNGTGSLICNGTPTATVERFVKNGRWNMVSPGTTGTTGQTFFGTNGNDSWLTYFSEPNGTNNGAVGDGWAYLSSLSDPVHVGQGYSYWPSVDETIQFKGNLQTTDLPPTISWTDTDHGYNLIGNPFSSALLWDGSWTMTNVNNAIWIWDGTQYQANPGGFTNYEIPVGQGFFVRANGSNPAITIPASKRLHSTQAFLKSSKVNMDKKFNHLILKAQNNHYTDKAFIYFDKSGTDAYDNGFDAEKMFGLTDAPQLYLVENGLKETYDFLPAIEDGKEKTVTLGYIAGTAGEQKIIADFTYFAGADVTLEDLKTGNTQNLSKEHTYKFTGSKDDDPGRFLLHFAGLTDGIGKNAESTSNIHIYAYGKAVYIQLSNKAVNQTGNVFVYDLMGRQLVHQQIESGKRAKLNVNVTNSYVVVRVVKNGFFKTEKVFIK